MRGLASGVVVSETDAYVADRGGLQVIDIRNPESAQMLGSVDTPGPANDVDIAGYYAYVADGHGFHVIDIRNPQSPQILGSVDTPGLVAWAVVISGIHAFVADSNCGLQVIDIEDPRNPQIVAGDELGFHDTRGVAISGTYAYLADDPSGLQIVDIRNPRNPHIVGSIVTPGAAFGVAASGNYAYVAAGLSGAQIIDVTNPQMPWIMSHVPTPSYATGVAVSGGRLYVTDRSYGLGVIDVTNPQHPQVLGSVDTPGSANSVSISGNYAYVADYLAGLHLIDITDPRNPRLVGSLDTPGAAMNVVVSETGTYVADWDSGLQILPSQCPPLPIFLTSFALSRSEDVVEIRWAVRRGESGGEFRLSASRREERWDVPVDPQPGPRYVALDRSQQLATGGEVLYRLFYRGTGEGWLVLAEQSIGLGTTGGPTRLLAPHPNPAKARVVIPFSSGYGGQVRLTVHDVAGREVAQVFEGMLRPGAGHWIWSLEESRRGGKLASGMYLIRLATEHSVQTRKVVLVQSNAP